MPSFIFKTSAEQTNEEIPSNLVARLPPNYTIRYFYIRLLVAVSQPLNPRNLDGPVLILGHQFQLMAPHDLVLGVTGLSWNAIIQFLNMNGIPMHVVNEVSYRIIDCISRMFRNPDNHGRMLLPMLVLISCTASVLALQFLATVAVETEGVCFICRARMEVGSSGGRLPCTHCFHDGCIRRSIPHNPSCPVCGFMLA